MTIYNNSLVCGKVNNLHARFNTWQLTKSGVSITSDYPISNISVDYHDLYFDIDLRKANPLEKIKIKINYDTSTEYAIGEFSFDTEYATVTTEAGLTSVFANGGVINLGADITLTGDLTVNNSVMIYGNNNTINLAGHKINVRNGKTFKAENTVFTNGKHTITQAKESNVELTNCTFTNCLADNGHASVIDCDVDLDSLDFPIDFKTSLTSCNISNSDMCILHGGELTITNCEVTGKLNNYDYPYFLYQTDGTAEITQSVFHLTSNTTINEDIKFNSCIFVCGETATINNLTHAELSNNNITSFLNNNTSNINITYYYELIEDNITLESDKGYCHSVSGTDYVFKTNITPTRSG